MTGGFLCWRKYSTISVYAYDDKLPLEASPISHIWGEGKGGTKERPPMSSATLASILLSLRVRCFYRALI